QGSTRRSLDSDWSSLSARVRGFECDPSLRSECLSCAALEQSCEAIRDPGPGRRWSREQEQLAIPGLRLDRRQPDLVGGLADTPPKLGLDRAPRRRRLRLRGQRQGTPPRSVEVKRFKKGRRESARGRRIYNGDVGLEPGVDAKRGKK